VARPGILYVVSTPIGNLEDITLRALRVLKEVDLIAAEDTRHTAKLLNNHGISARLTSFFEHNQAKRGPQLVRLLEKGKNVALVSDAGTPILSDPGMRLVQLCVENGISIVPIPGPSAAICALSVAGVPFKSFVFEGFLPSKPGARRRRLRELSGEARPMVFYESPRRLKNTLKDIVHVFGEDRTAVAAKEMTKLFERFYRGTAGEIIEQIEADGARGEYTLIVCGASSEQPPETSILDDLKNAVEKEGLTVKDAVAAVAGRRKVSKRQVYQESLRLRKKDSL
jgi:16S rRNA (cytidine1402-2'-O)-methyltransferase